MPSVKLLPIGSPVTTWSAPGVQVLAHDVGDRVGIAARCAGADQDDEELVASEQSSGLQRGRGRLHGGHRAVGSPSSEHQHPGAVRADADDLVHPR